MATLKKALKELRKDYRQRWQIVWVIFIASLVMVAIRFNILSGLFAIVAVVLLVYEFLKNGAKTDVMW